MQHTPQKKVYSTPRLIKKGDISELTQQTKTFGNGDGVILVIPNVDADPIPLTNYS